MKDWLVYFSFFVFTLTIIFLVIRFFVDTKITALIDSVFRRKSIEKAKEIEAANAETDVDNIDVVSLVRKGPFETFTAFVTRFTNMFRSGFQRFWEAYQTKVPPNVRLLINIALIVLFSRIIIQIFAYIGTLYVRGEALSFEALWRRWDAQHYLSLAEAKEWYMYIGGSEKTEIFIVFYPLYPALVKIFALITGGNAFWAAELVSTLCLIGSAFFLYKLVLIDYGKKLAFNSVKYMLIFPVSFFFMAPFTESLFVMLSILTFYCLKKERWFLAGIFGMFAGLTRFHGIILIVPFIIEFLISKDIFARLFSKERKQAVKDIFTKGINAFLIPCGYLLYLLLNYVVTGDAFKYLFWQKTHWFQEFSLTYLYDQNNLKLFPIPSGIKTVSDNISGITDLKLFAALWLPQMIIITAAMLLILYAIKIKFKLQYFSYMSIFIFGTISLSWLLSSPRYILAAFPIYILLALLSKNKKVDLIITIASIMMLMYCTVMFVTGGQFM